MTPAQRTHLFADLWPAACAAQHWDPRDRERRLEVCGDAVSRTISSANDLDSKDDYTAVKRHLLILAGDLKAAGEGAEANGERTRRWKIKQQLRCLAIYPLETPMGLTGVRHTSGHLSATNAIAPAMSQMRSIPPPSCTSSTSSASPI